ncbi:Bifunctional transpeptidase/transglycosylase [Rhodospirillaceae bacterium LM-1]|nr:Bifunctional transpeptidase/transglycosylase [Rhodospirillaceae bacterium LM-1]
MRPRKPFLVGAATGVLLLLGLDLFFPPDMSRYEEASQAVTDAGGQLLRAFTTTDGMWRLRTDVQDVDPRYLDLLIAYEDKRFWRHPGVDPLALARALGQWVSSGHVVSGASTLTMQAARLLEPRQRGIGAKFVEMLRALQLERRYSKREILGIYLTLAPFIGNVEGVQAATLSLFGKSPSQLTVGESALLVALPQSPAARHPVNHPEAARAGRGEVLKRLVERDRLDSQTANEAGEEGLPTARMPFPFLAPHLAQGLIERDKSSKRLVSILDAKLQASAESLIKREAEWYNDQASIAAIAVRIKDRAVRMYVGGHDFFGPQGQVDLAKATRSPGSTLKPFIYGMAFDELMAMPQTRIQDLPKRFGDWAPKNFDRDYHGRVTVQAALQQSLNLPALAVLERLGPERFAAQLRTAGATLQLPGGRTSIGLPLALGGVGMTLRDLVMLYAALGDEGKAKPLRYLADAADERSFPVMSPDAAWTILGILGDGPRPDGIADTGSLSRRISYKTGTSYGFRDAWAVGVSNGYVVGVWVGRADGTPRPGFYGRQAAAPIMFKLFDQLPQESGAPSGLLKEASLRYETPLALARFEDDDDLKPHILYPPDSSLIELARQKSGGLGALTLRAEGGALPLRWLVNGMPIASDERLSEASWQPDGEGFVHVVVIDAKDRIDTASVRLK